MKVKTFEVYRCPYCGERLEIDIIPASGQEEVDIGQLSCGECGRGWTISWSSGNRLEARAGVPFCRLEMGKPPTRY